MHPKTIECFERYTQQVAEVNGVSADRVAQGKQFAVDPQGGEKLETKIVETNEFLNRIQVVSVVNQKGRKIGISASRSIAGRVDTSGNTRRHPTDPHGRDEFGYMCENTQFDSALPYATLDAWRHHPDFATRIQAVIAQQIGLDRIMIGWNGTSVAVDTDRVANPLLQDVNIGWLEKIRTEAAEQHIDGYTIGAAGDAKNLDAAVKSAVDNLIGPLYQESTDLVAVCGRSLYADHVTGFINDYGEPTEKVATNIIIAEKKLGGLPALRVPFFPDNAFLVTPLNNLSIYHQEGTKRRRIVDEPEYERIADYQNDNECYNVEDYDAAAFVENITAV